MAKIIIPAGTQFAGIPADVDTKKRSALINEHTLVYKLEDLKGYRYVAQLTQTGTAAPAATVLENGTLGTIAWTRTSAGVYTGTSSIPWGGTVVATVQNTPKDVATDISVTSVTASTIVITTKADSGGWAVDDDILSATNVVIEIFPTA